MDDAIRKAEALIEALAYIRRFRDRLTVIKLGGSAMEDPAALEATLKDVVFLETAGMRPVLVHGGGKPIDRAMAAAGLQPKKIQAAATPTPPPWRSSSASCYTRSTPASSPRSARPAAAPSASTPARFRPFSAKNC